MGLRRPRRYLKSFLDAVRNFLTKYELKRFHGDPFHDQFHDFPTTNCHPNTLVWNVDLNKWCFVGVTEGRELSKKLPGCGTQLSDRIWAHTSPRRPISQPKPCSLMFCHRPIFVTDPFSSPTHFHYGSIFPSTGLLKSGTPLDFCATPWYVDIFSYRISTNSGKSSF